MVGCSTLARRCVASEMVGCSALARRCVATRRLHSTAPMTLYHCVGARSLRVLWAFKELGMSEYDLVTMPFPPRAHHRPFLELNPLGTIPLLVHGDAKLTESCAGAVYAAEAVAPDGPLLVRPAEPDYASFLNWNYHADATLTFPQTLVLRYRDFARRRRPPRAFSRRSRPPRRSRTRTSAARRTTTPSGSSRACACWTRRSRTAATSSARAGSRSRTRTSATRSSSAARSASRAPTRPRPRPTSTASSAGPRSRPRGPRRRRRSRRGMRRMGRRRLRGAGVPAYWSCFARSALRWSRSRSKARWSARSRNSCFAR